MFSILGEGRGHLTQAIAVKEMVEKKGHQVTSIVLGVQRHRELPPYFASAMKMPITRISTFNFSFVNNRKVNLRATLMDNARALPDYWRSLRTLKTLVRETQPDVIFNFFDSMTGIYALTTRNRPPVVSIGHQFMCEHPAYVSAPGRRLQQLGLKWYIRLVGAASTQVALSLYEAPDNAAKNLFVSPPLLRRQLFDLQPNPDGKFVLVYLLNHGYATQIIDWHKKNPGVVLHCFYDKPGAPAEAKWDETLTFHRLDGEKFLRMMAECKYVASTAGFESLGEAAYLGKPLFLVPVENHIEQQLNAIDASRMGIAVADTSFRLDRLAELPARLDNARYHSWLNRADAILGRALEHAVAQPPAKPSQFFHWKPAEPKAI